MSEFNKTKATLLFGAVAVSTLAGLATVGGLSAKRVPKVTRPLAAPMIDTIGPKRQIAPLSYQLPTPGVAA